jgi:hypothetical protein
MVNTAPHFGHLIFVSFDTPAHPKENTAKRANTKEMLTHFLITTHLLSSIRLFALIQADLTLLPCDGDEIAVHGNRCTVMEVELVD